MKDGRCSKHFPKPFCDATRIGDDAYACYKRIPRSAGGNSFVKGGMVFDDSRVVPHSPSLLCALQCHVNIEKIVSARAIAYLFKYVFKGSDRSLVSVGLAEGAADGNANGTVDEVQKWMDVRYLSSHEACWKAMGYGRAEQSPGVQHLSFHLPNSRRVSFRVDGARESTPVFKSTLKAMFKLNREDPRANCLLYQDLPKFYVLNVDKEWVARRRGEEDAGAPGLKRGNKIGVLPGVVNVAKNREAFALHVLLTKVPGPTGFEMLRTFDGVEYDNFTDAAFARGLLIEERGADQIMRECQHLDLRERRQLFVRLLLYWRIRAHGAFFERHKASLLGSQRDVRDRTQQLLRHLKRLLFVQGRTPSEFGIPEPERFNPQNGLNRNQIREAEFFVQFRYGSDEDHDLAVASLNPEQRSVYDAVSALIAQHQGGLVCIDAPGGTGKTYLLNTVAKSMNYLGRKTVCTASSGIASLLLTGGRTLHSAFNVPIRLDEGSTCAIDKNSAKGDLVRQLDLLIWDEVTMFSYRVLDCLDRSLRDLRSSELPFGGVTVVLSGDWRQILPVVKNGAGRAAIVGMVLKKSSLWANAVQFSLRRNMRVEGEDEAADEFRNFLLSVGDGTANEPAVSRDAPAFKMRMPDDMILQGTCQMSDLVDFVYRGLNELVGSADYPEWISKRAIVCGTNEEVGAYNSLVASQLQGEAKLYASVDEPRYQPGYGGAVCPVGFLNALEISGIPPHKLDLKAGMPVILMRNLDHSAGHVNGSRYIVQSCNDHSVVAVNTSGVTFVFFRMKFAVSEEDYPVAFDRFQFPLRPCFAITANKAQGQTLERVGISLLRNFFTHGQLYVAMSRVRSRGNVKALLPVPGSDAVDIEGQFVDNVVYGEVLNDNLANVMDARQEPLEFSLDEELDVDEAAHRIVDDDFPESDDSNVYDDNGNIDDEGDEHLCVDVD